MGFKENMMEGMMKGMSAEDKTQMMNTMMDSFFRGMSEDEKKSMMNSMMPKMMGSMMGGNGGMMGMMGSMMGGGKDGKGDFNPMDMCRTMMTGMNKTGEMATYATPEIRALFEEWSVQIEEEILEYIKKTGSIDPENLSEQFKLSRASIDYFLVKLAGKGKISLKAEKI